MRVGSPFLCTYVMKQGVRLGTFCGATCKGTGARAWRCATHSTSSQRSVYDIVDAVAQYFPVEPEMDSLHSAINLDRACHTGAAQLGCWVCNRYISVDSVRVTMDRL